MDMGILTGAFFCIIALVNIKYRFLMPPSGVGDILSFVIVAVAVLVVSCSGGKDLFSDPWILLIVFLYPISPIIWLSFVLIGTYILLLPAILYSRYFSKSKPITVTEWQIVPIALSIPVAIISGIVIRSALPNIGIGLSSRIARKATSIETSAKDLEEISRYPDLRREVKLALCSNWHTPSSVLKNLATGNYGDYDFAVALAQNMQTPDSVLEELAANSNHDQVLSAISHNMTVSCTALDLIVNRSDMSVDNIHNFRATARSKYLTYCSHVKP